VASPRGYHRTASTKRVSGKNRPWLDIIPTVGLLAIVLCSFCSLLADNILSSVFSHSPSLDAQQPGSPGSAYTTGSPHLGYPPTPDDLPLQYVNPQDVSPSPTVSPDQVCTGLPDGSPSFGSSVVSNAYVVAEPTTPSSLEFDDGASDVPFSADVVVRPFEYTNELPRKRKRVASDDEESRTGSPLDSGESEREEDGDDDDEYRPDARESRRSVRRKITAKSQSTRSVSPVEIVRPRLAPPVPIPNLTKKSRGRRVPTDPVLVSQNGIERVRCLSQLQTSGPAYSHGTPSHRTSAITRARCLVATSASSVAST
jgi:hypothetical protein